MRKDAERLLNPDRRIDPFERELTGSVRELSVPPLPKAEAWRKAPSTGSSGPIPANATGPMRLSTARDVAAPAGNRWGVGWKLLGATKLTLAFVLGAASGGSVYWYQETVHATRSVRAASPETATSWSAAKGSDPQQPKAAAAASETQAAPPSEAKQKPPVVVAPAPADEAEERGEPAAEQREVRTSVESRLLKRARAQLRAGDSIGAQATLARMKRRYPRGELVQERQLLGIQALNALGQAAAARRAAHAFATAHPNSRQLRALEPLLLGR